MRTEEREKEYVEVREKKRERREETTTNSVMNTKHEHPITGFDRLAYETLRVPSNTRAKGFTP